MPLLLLMVGSVDVDGLSSKLKQGLPRGSESACVGEVVPKGLGQLMAKRSRPMVSNTRLMQIREPHLSF